MAIAGGLLLAGAALAWFLRGIHLQAGPLELSIQRPLLAATQALAVLLIREALGSLSTLGSRLRFLGLLAAFIAGLATPSRPRIVGDGPEYVAMAWKLSMGRMPALTTDELGRLESLLPGRIEAYELAKPELRSADGRQDFYHPWAYSLLAAPFVAVALWLGQPLLPAFTVLNGLLLLLAAFVLLARHGPRVTLLVLGGAILWWIDKAHSEIFTVALLVAAVALLPVRPGLSMSVQGFVGLQNSAFGVTLLASALWRLRQDRLRDKGARVGLVVALLFWSAGPAYYAWRLGQASPLSSTVLPHWPSLAELGAVLIDSNLGLVFAWPSLVLAVVVAAAATARGKTLKTHTDTVVLLAGTAAVLLFAATQPANLNHGGTRGVSRYALWLVPVIVPLLAHFDRSARWARGVLLALAAGSLVTALTEYNPSMSERYVSPTPAADWLWRRWPTATNPLPEVFAERTSHFEGPGVVPTATARCEKALLVGDGTRVGTWPLWCRPAESPPACSVVGAYCYANRTPTGTSFVVAPRQPAFDGLRPLAWWWSGSPDDSLTRFLEAIPWEGLRPADPRNTDALFADRRGLGPVRARINAEVLLVWIERPREGAWVSLQPGGQRRAVLLDPQRATVLQHVALDPSLPTTLPIPYASPLLLIVVPTSVVPLELTTSPAAEAKRPAL